MLATHIFHFLIGIAIMWFASGLIVTGIERFSRSTKISTFASSFLILGVLTSLTEISVGLNAVLERKPSIFVGNLIGGSFVILTLIIPILAIWSGGITLRHRLDQKRLLFFLVMLAAPSVLILDGAVGSLDAFVLLVMYILFIHSFEREQEILDHLTHQRPKHLGKSIAGILIGAIMVYFAGKILVDKTIIFAELLSVSPLFLSLLVLSVGTNLPELTLAFRSIRRKHAEIAFGDYIGSAATNVILFAIFTFLHGPFILETKGFSSIFFIIIIGYFLFFLFSRIKTRISPAEGLLLILVYIIFLLFQTTEILSLSPKI